MNKSFPLLKRIWQIVIIILLNLLVIAFFNTGAKSEASALSKIGSRGTEVKQVQTKLKSLGFYRYTVDGIYGVSTSAAVKRFQKSRGITADGVSGSKTLLYLGVAKTKTAGKSTSSKSNLNLLARVVSAESRGEPYKGQVAVAAVILNRTSHPSFPDTVAGVVYRPGAFTCMTDGQFNVAIDSGAYKAAQAALNGWDPSGGAIYYYNPKTAVNNWIRSRPVIVTIGGHVFCK